MDEIFEERAVWNRYRQEYEPKRVRKTLTAADRLGIVREYFETGLPASKIIEKYQLSSKTVLFGWIDKYINEEKELSAKPACHEVQSKTEDDLRREVEMLRKALALEKLRSEAYSTMIDVAEKTFDIPIRKKSGTKQ